MEENKPEAATPNKKESENSLKKFDTVIAFLGVEIIGLVLFGFGGVLGIRLLQLFGVLVSFFAFPFLREKVDNRTLKRSILWLIPLMVFCLLGSFSLFYYAYFGGKSGLLIFVFYSVLQFVGLVSFFLLGACLRKIGALKTRYVIYGLLGALGLLVGIILIYSLIRYGFFYAVKYKDMVYYFDGVPFRLDIEGKTLVGFSLLEATLLYASRPAFVLACAGAALFAISPKKEKRLFLVVACLSALGWVYLISIPYLQGLAALLGVYFVFGLLRLLEWIRKSHQKGIDVTYRVFFFLGIAVVALGTILLLTEDKTNFFTKLNLRKEGNLFDRLFIEVGDMLYNGNHNKPIYDMKTILLGYEPLTNNGFATIHTDRIFEVNLLCQNGVPCFLLFCYLFFYFLKKEKDYLHDSRDSFGERFLFLSLVFGIFIHFSFFSSEVPLRHSDNQLFVTYMNSSWHLVLMALLGFTFIAPKGKEVTHA